MPGESATKPGIAAIWSHHLIKVVTPEGFTIRLGLSTMIAVDPDGGRVMSAFDFSHLACPNPECPAYGQRGAGNLCLHGWSGKSRRIRCLHCNRCGRDFSERANTPLFGLHSSEDTLVAIARHLAEGFGVL